MVSCIIVVASLVGSPPAAELPGLPEVERGVAVTGEGYFPVLIRLADGRLAAVVRGGATHLGKEGRLDWIESSDGGTTWSKPRVIVDGPWDDRNPAFGQMPNGSIVLAYAVCSCYGPDGQWDPSTGGFDFFTVCSDDGGATWAPPQPLETPFPKGGSPYGRIAVTPDGLALLSVYGAVTSENSGRFLVGPESATDACGFLVSRDNGRTWDDFHPIARGFNETTVVAVTAKKLLAFARSDSDQCLAVLRSDDAGNTWSEPETLSLPAQHPGDAALLPGGQVLVVYGSRQTPCGVHAFRAPIDSDLALAPRVALADDSRNTDQGYPSVVALADGRAVVLYYAVGTDGSPDITQAPWLRFDPSALPGADLPASSDAVNGSGPEDVPEPAEAAWADPDRFPWTTREIPRPEHIN